MTEHQVDVIFLILIIVLRLRECLSFEEIPTVVDRISKGSLLSAQ